MVNANEFCGYIGRMKQPLQKPEVDNPSMFFIMDSSRIELDLILLTPGCLLHAYRFIKAAKAVSVKLFVPSLRPEFISDVINLYMLLKDSTAFDWVYPEGCPHFDFSKGQIRSNGWMNVEDHMLNITYVENEHVAGVHDIIVRTHNGTHYFSYYLTEDKLKSLYNDRLTTFIHIPKASTMYGGLCYDSAVKLHHKYRKKLAPHDFASLEEFYAFNKRELPEGDKINQITWYSILGDDTPQDFDGIITDEEINELLDDDTSQRDDNEEEGE